MAEHINKVPATHLHDTGTKSHVSTSQASGSPQLRPKAERLGDKPLKYYATVKALGVQKNLMITTCNISNTRKSVSSDFPNKEKWIGKTRHCQGF